MRFSFFLPVLSRDRRPKARALASGNGLAGSCYGGRLKGRGKRRDDGGMSTIVFIRNPRSAVASFKRVMPSGCRRLSLDPAVLRTASKAHDLGVGGEYIQSIQTKLGTVDVLPPHPIRPAFLHAPLTTTDTSPMVQRVGATLMEWEEKCKQERMHTRLGVEQMKGSVQERRSSL